MDTLTEIFKTSGGWNEGHTSFKNGFHGNGWIEKWFVIRFPKLLEEATKAQAKLVKKYAPDVELLIGPEINGSIIASHIGRHLDKTFTITKGKGAEIEFHRMYNPPVGTKVVVIDDLSFSGTDIESNVKFLKDKGMEVLGVFIWINRQKDEFDGVKVYSLIKPPFEYYTKEECPLCKSGIPVKYENIRE
jgi:orotate phosphoribosyltransferase